MVVPVSAVVVGVSMVVRVPVVLFVVVRGGLHEVEGGGGKVEVARGGCGGLRPQGAKEASRDKRQGKLKCDMFRIWIVIKDR